MLDPVVVGWLSIALIFFFILIGFHVGIALALVSFGGVYLITGRIGVSASLLQTTAFNAVMDYTFAVVPLFVVMGLFVTLSGATTQLFNASQIMTRGVRGGLGVSTVAANAVFAAITGVSVASAAVFSKIAMPEMSRLGYDRKFSLGIIASSALLGMLIPPSVLMIIYGVLTEQSIARLFAAGIGPGLLVAGLLIVGIVIRAAYRPALVGNEVGARRTVDVASNWKTVAGTWPIVVIIVAVLGGIYGGWFTPVEAGAVGAFLGLLLAIARRKLTPSGLLSILLESGLSVANIFFLLTTAQMYSRMLTLSGLPDVVVNTISQWQMAGFLVICVFVLVILALGAILDSVSILLLTVPILVPVAATFGYDPIWFGMIVIVAVEIGLLTPPFGMVVFAMKAALPDDVRIEEIFQGTIPFYGVLLVALLLIMTFPQISTYLPAILLGS